ncbi:hypothetical protein CEUSTIGMA_g2061.t1 [Chlamydomonas eustigma]|uniref:protein-ribulosamine 3-kinase n=1 Tax=Chlamydomonas eustigma TaxID=1157962 RepID=A0A250WUU5_9CHLO|nr:hypothetical protein CEUSTIGMA_g2061.t1 [Chlamydomonas eustigma]|eukprot:GAX74613.1 hypothetical protein CEUSTIGMA_g2061.t1 [Chlamydomonas eustigma]
MYNSNFAHNHHATQLRARHASVMRRGLFKEDRFSLNASPSSEIVTWIEKNVQDAGSVISTQSHGDSSWSSTMLYNTSSGMSFFVKSSGSVDMTMFKGEALGLLALADADAVRVPKVYHYGDLKESRGTFIVMEALKLGGQLNPKQLGHALARMHSAAPKDSHAAQGKFGFPVDNTIGGIPQPNAWMDDWVDFFRDQRLGHQLRLTGDITLQRYGDRLLPHLDHFFEGAQPIRPCILHGDLWSGNMAACIDTGEAVTYDPACYYGHHEAEWGMSWCAGFNETFWQSYREVIPNSDGWEDRRKLYTLYHILNHYNLFGRGYFDQAEGLLKTLVDRHTWRHK